MYTLNKKTKQKCIDEGCNIIYVIKLDKNLSQRVVEDCELKKAPSNKLMSHASLE